MGTAFTWLVVVVAVALGTVLISFLVEALRPAPPVPGQFAWAPAIPIRYLEVDGVRLRYTTTGKGPPPVLLHTLRTQLDLLLMSARGNRRVARVVSINPYDDAAGTGLRRSSVVANLSVGLGRIPVPVDTVVRLRKRMVEERIFEGGGPRMDVNGGGTAR